ncbi:Hpt domain-containing protein [Ferrovibrio sp.]|uniref:Hpt domain-containing protein n=1 Tax=Ferrovibrio sp. TaxID=1917215 RepID=UPI0035B07649
MRPLTEAFGSFDANAQALLRDFVDDTEQKVAALTRQIAERTGHAVLRDLSHMLKGAARSVGARRLGNVAGDLQDACDAGDDGRIALLAGMLGPSLDELRQTLPLILKSGDRNA